MTAVISVENLKKKYIIRHESAPYATLRDKLAHPIKSIKNSWKSRPEAFWALDDLLFDVGPGETVGIIGPNGSGKSTLLKVLSRITPPTSGRAILKGKVSSLLEVGTGFHPELSGRENIFLSGVILGMTKLEIRKKFEEIVAFAGVEKFLDTPVKYYSSGMGVRLGFAVAAHLSSDIMIIDEVLAVGDTEFQKKCLGKMDEVAKNQGRTILFVSHDMRAVQSLCSKGLFLKNGRIVSQGLINQVIESYVQDTFLKSNNPVVRGADVQIRGPWVKEVAMRDNGGNLKNVFMADDCINLELSINTSSHPKPFNAYWTLTDMYGRQIAVGASAFTDSLIYGDSDDKIISRLYPKSLVPGKYILSFSLYSPGMPNYDDWFNAVTFEISANIVNKKFHYPGLWTATQFVDFDWSSSKNG